VRPSRTIAVIVIAALVAVAASHAAYACSSAPSHAAHCGKTHPHSAKTPPCCEREPATTTLAARAPNGIDHHAALFALGLPAAALAPDRVAFAQRRADRARAPDRPGALRLHLVLSTLIV